MKICKTGRMSIIAAALVAAAVAGAEDIKVDVNGHPVRFENSEPRYVDGRVLVPLRGVFEEMGAFVQWHPETRTVTAQKGDKDVTLWIGERRAKVDGEAMTLDVPPMIMNGSTMVPIRFISESLGAEVAWNDARQTVMISTEVASHNPGRPIEFANRRKFTIAAGTVIPVTLDTRVSSRDARKGDRIRATVDEFNTGNVSWERNDFDFPRGTTVEGRIVSAVARNGNRPGLIEMDFNKLIMPDGKTVSIEGSLIALDSKSVTRDEDGVFRSRNNNKDNRTVYAGYGAGAGLLVGLISKRPLENLAIGGILGFLAGSVEQSQRKANDVTLEPGTHFGIRLDQSATISLKPNNR